MKKILFSFIFSLVAATGFTQIESFDLLKFHIPAGWTHQARQPWVSYTGTDPETNTPVEIIIHKSQSAAPKIDSSFRTEWRRVFDAGHENHAVPPARKRNSANGLQYAENGLELTHGGQKKYAHLFVFTANGKVQSIQVNVSKVSAYKALRLFVDELLGSVDTLVKAKE